jgi:Raf kinase inhibitor-like YbhB/YbcL family protein
MHYFNFLSLILFASMVSPVYSAGSFSLSSSSYQTGSVIPAKFTCDGSDTSPTLTWNNAPANTKSFAIIFSDPDAPSGTFYHWVLYNIPAATNSLPENASNLPAGTLIGENSFGGARYNGPCPPRGSNHHYVMTIYALDVNLDLRAGADANTVLNALKTHVLDQAELTSTFGH